MKHLYIKCAYTLIQNVIYNYNKPKVIIWFKFFVLRFYLPLFSCRYSSSVLQIAKSIKWDNNEKNHVAIIVLHNKILRVITGEQTICNYLLKWMKNQYIY